MELIIFNKQIMEANNQTITNLMKFYRSNFIPTEMKERMHGISFKFSVKLFNAH